MHEQIRITATQDHDIDLQCSGYKFTRGYSEPETRVKAPAQVLASQEAQRKLAAAGHHDAVRLFWPPRRWSGRSLGVLVLLIYQGRADSQLFQLLH